MPIITAGSKLLPKLNVYTDQQQQRLGPRSAIPICAAAGLLLIIFFLLPSVPLWLIRRLACWKSTARTNTITWAPKPKIPLSRSHPKAAAGSRVLTRPKQSRGRAAEPAAGNLTISRGEPSGTALVGFGGFGGRSMMEEEEKTTRPPATSRSRGVSTDWSHGTGRSKGLPGPDPSFPEVDQSHHVSTSPSSPDTPSPSRRDGGDLTSSAEIGQSSSMDGDGLEGSSSIEAQPAGGSGYRPGAAWQESPKDTMFSLAHHMIDDESVFYGAIPSPSGAAHEARDQFTPRAFYLDFDRPPPPSVVTSTPAHPYSSYQFERSPTKPIHSAPDGVVGAGHRGAHTAHGRIEIPDQADARDLDAAGRTMGGDFSDLAGEHGHHQTTESIPIMPPSAPVADSMRARADADDPVMSASSYPSASPTLPPPPPAAEGQPPFDPSAIMFPGPGAVVDGGIRTVSPPGHGASAVHGALGPHSGTDSHSGWKRHTRVYEGGVCLACAAAEEGGFYGTRVRPEDKR